MRLNFKSLGQMRAVVREIMSVQLNFLFVQLNFGHFISRPMRYTQ